MANSERWIDVGYTFVDAGTQLRDTIVSFLNDIASQFGLRFNELGFQVLVALVSIAILYVSFQYVANPLFKFALIALSIILIASFFVPSP